MGATMARLLLVVFCLEGIVGATTAAVWDTSAHPLIVFDAAASGSNETLCDSNDREALLAMASSIDASYLSLQLQWKGLNCCSWTGVVCQTLTGRVTHLSLFNATLSGTFPQAICNLSQLWTLDLSYNYLRGSIPSCLGNLSQIYNLVLNDNQLGGSIPSSLGSLPNLDFLDLSGNRLEGPIPPEFGLLPSLEALHLQNNLLSGSIPSTFGNSSVFLDLYVQNNNLTGTIPESFANTTRLCEFLVSGNRLTIGSIPKFFIQLPYFCGLGLGSSGLKGSIPCWLADSNSTYFSFLDLSQNALTGSIPDCLSRFQTLNLSFNSFDSLPRSGFSGYGGNLMDLDLHFNNLSGDLMGQFSSNLSSLTILDLSDNQLQGTVLPPIGSLRYLVYLDLSKNRLEGDVLSSALRSNYSDNYLSVLDLSDNFLSGKVPELFNNYPNIIKIKLQQNNLTGTIPYQLAVSNNTALQTLALGNNSLSGEVPVSLGGYTNLLVLDLSWNQLNGSLESWLYKLRNLRVLLLSRNRFQTSIPGFLSSFSSVLQIIDLSNNKFSGVIPANLHLLHGFQNSEAADLGGGQTLYDDSVFITIYNDLRNYSYVLVTTTSFDISANQFQGNIPVEFGTLVGTRFLNLSNNRLTGSIPKELGNMYLLLSLDVSKNDLNGSIPMTLSQLTFLNYLNVSYNNLSGVIPQGDQFNSFTSESYLGNRGLCGLPLPKCNQTVPNSGLPSSAPPTFDHIIIIVSSTVAFVVVVLCVVVVTLCYLWARKKQGKGQSIRHEMPQEYTHFQRFTMEDMVRATQDFSDLYILGSGGSSVVYKGTMKNGDVVAVKVFCQKVSHDGFLTECKTLGQIRHRNLISILGSCSNLDFQALVLEYMPNGSLDFHLHELCDLSWDARFKVLLGVAHAISYLHHDTGIVCTVHCNLKPSNILLNEDLEPRVADFGIAKLLDPDSVYGQATASSFKGTIGYCAPEYGSSGVISTKVDVYSYGVIVLELLTRRKPTDVNFGGNIDLPSWVRMSSQGMFLDLLDSSLQGQHAKNQSEMLQVMKLGLSCTLKNPKERPNMKEVLETLIHIRTDALHISTDHWQELTTMKLL